MTHSLARDRVGDHIVGGDPHLRIVAGGGVNGLLLLRRLVQGEGEVESCAASALKWSV